MALSHSSFALALIALHLPDLQGLTLARRLRQAPAPVGTMPIIMFGDAWDPERILDSCRETGLAGYLPKPISIARLVSSIHDHIHRPQGEPGAPPTMPQPPAFEVERLTSFTDGDHQLERELDLALSGDGGGVSRRDARRLERRRRLGQGRACAQRRQRQYRRCGGCPAGRGGRAWRAV